MVTKETSQTDTSRPRGRRRTYLINPSFQRKYTLTVVGGVFIISTFLSYTLFGVLHQQARARVVQPYATSAWDNVGTILLAGIAFSAVLAVAFGLYTVVVTHRISGPLFVLERYLSELTSGRLPQRRALRKKDEFKSLNEAFWRAVDSLRAGKQVELHRLTELLKIARTGAEKGEPDSTQALESVAERLEAMCAQEARSLGKEFADVSKTPPKDRVGAGRTGQVRGGTRVG